MKKVLQNEVLNMTCFNHFTLVIREKKKIPCSPAVLFFLVNVLSFWSYQYPLT